MECLIEILLVEDSELDALLLQEELKRHQYAPLCRRVQTEEEFTAALKERAWDAIICDYLLPDFDGPKALAVFRSLALDTPFIVVSGKCGEERAVGMMKAGADDYILKSNLARLVPALERELESAQERRRRRRAEGAMQYLAAIVESSEDAIYGKTLDSMISSWNPAAERLFGYSAAEIIGQSIVALYPLNRRDELLDSLSSIRRGETVGLVETERLHKDGRVVPVSITISPIKDIHGAIIGASTIARDISRQKQAEQERRLLHDRLFEATDHVRKLGGMLPICASCKRIRDDEGYWQQVETYISRHSEVIFSHGLCPKCAVDYERQFELGDTPAAAPTPPGRLP